MLNKIGNWCYKVVVIFALAVGLAWGGYIVYVKRFSEYARYERTRVIYKQILVASGQSQDKVPLVIIKDESDNARNHGDYISINSGAIDNVDSWDEVAFTLGHEVAHGMLGHTTGRYKIVDEATMAVAEANADKLAAFYIMRAGYDICKARVMFKRYHDNDGDELNQKHPDNSYRYSALNINCGGDL